jgi:hypothetical protein
MAVVNANKNALPVEQGNAVRLDCNGLARGVKFY